MTNPVELPLKDIHLPDTISFWPPAIGWWLLVIICSAIIAATIVFIQRYRKKWGYRKIALRLLNEQYQTWKTTKESDKNSQKTLSEMLTLLKRVAISAYPSENLSALFGTSWVEFLNRQTSTNYFNHSLIEAINTQQYLSNKTID